MNLIIAIDPGRSKCGLVLADPAEVRVLAGTVVAADAVIDVIQRWQEQAPVQTLLLGNGTGSSYWHQKLSTFAPVQLVEEHGSTLRARSRYWQIWPPQGWQRFLPRGLLYPPVPLDAVAALVIMEDHLQRQLNWSGPPEFRTSL